ncbi:MAG: hypothetical protein IJU93_02975 [Lachnospiraceae bacterium]|nr:hypothetical protein [Lachnospiraceae bacterium]
MPRRIKKQNLIIDKDDESEYSDDSHIEDDEKSEIDEDKDIKLDLPVGNEGAEKNILDISKDKEGLGLPNENMLKEEEEADDVLNQGFISYRSKKSKKSSSNKDEDKKSKKKPDKEKDKQISGEKNDASNNIEQGMQEVNSAMREVEGWNFTPVTPARTKISGWRKFWNRFAAGASKVIRTVVNALSGKTSAKKAKKATEKLIEAKETMQAKKNHDLIPGWGGATFDTTKVNDKGEEVSLSGMDILGDFRRIPAVWSYLTAAPALENDKVTPKAPEIGIYVQQAKAGSSKSLAGADMGHAFIGIDYSRFSNVSNRMERYSVRYGFYPALGGGKKGKFGSTVGMANDNAVFPGQMSNDRDHVYDISRRYKATDEQVGKIVKASQSYADRGYGYFSRNCTTFVKEMVVDQAQLDTGGGVFEDEEVRFSPLSNLLRVGAGFTGELSGSINAKQLKKMSEMEDMSYAGFGNKRASAEDADRYVESITNSVNSGSALEAQKTYIPGVVGENLRRINNDWETNGVMSSFHFGGSSGKKANKANPNIIEMQDDIRKYGNTLKGKLQEILPEGQDIPAELEGFISGFADKGAGSLTGLNQAWNDFLTSVKAEGRDPTSANLTELAFHVSHEDLIKAGTDLRENVETVSRMYSKYFKGDRRLDTAVMNYLSVLEMAISKIDNLYMSKPADDKVKGGHGEESRNLFNYPSTIQVGQYSAEMTASHYESYLQIFKTPAEAVKQYSKFQELSGKADRTSREEAELNRLKRIETLADEFDKSHRYMLEKDNFNQKDMNYIFSLEKLEKQDKAAGELMTNNYSSAATYKSMIYKDLFGDLSEAFNKSEEEGGVPLSKVDGLNSDQALELVKNWGDGYFTSHIRDKKSTLRMVFGGMKHADQELSEEAFAERLLEDVYNLIVFPLKVDRTDQNVREIYEALLTYLVLSKNNSSSKLMAELLSGLRTDAVAA